MCIYSTYGQTASLGSLDRLEWAKNCLGLCAFHLRQADVGSWGQAEHSLQSAALVLHSVPLRDPGDPDDAVLKVWSDLHLQWGRLCDAIMHAAKMQASRDQVDDGGESAAGSAPVNDETKRAAAPLPSTVSGETKVAGGEAGLSKEGWHAATASVAQLGLGGKFVPFRIPPPRRKALLALSSNQSLGEGGSGGPLSLLERMRSVSQSHGFKLGAKCRSPDDVVKNGFQSVRELFLSAKKSIDVAMGFYIEDGYVTDNVQCLQAISKLYSHLAAFEVDAKRRVAMAQRRVALLEPISLELNPKAYVLLLKELNFEMGNAMKEALEWKIERISEKKQQQQQSAANGVYVPTRTERKKCDEFAARGVAFFDRFLDIFCDQEGKRPDVVDDDNLPSVLLAQFQIARILQITKRFEPPRDRAQALVLSLEKYKSLIAFAERNIAEGSDMFAAELHLCREMVELLPSQIDQMWHEGREFS